MLVRCDLIPRRRVPWNTPKKRRKMDLCVNACMRRCGVPRNNSTRRNSKGKKKKRMATRLRRPAIGDDLAHPGKACYPTRPSLSASSSTRSGRIFGGGSLLCDADMYSAKPGIAPAWLIPGERPVCFWPESLEAFAEPPLSLAAELLPPPPPPLPPPPPPPQGRQPTHFPSFEDPDCVAGFEVERVLLADGDEP